MKKILTLFAALVLLTSASAQFSASVGTNTTDFGINLGVQYAWDYEDALVSTGVDFALLAPRVEANIGVHVPVADKVLFGARLYVPLYDAGSWFTFLDAGASVIYRFTPEISAEAGVRSVGQAKDIGVFLKFSYDIF